MKPATRQMIELALASDDTVCAEIAQEIRDVIRGRSFAERPGRDGPLTLTMTDAAKTLGVSRATLWRMVKAGILRPVEVMSGTLRIRRDDLHRVSVNYTPYQPARRANPTGVGQRCT